MQKLKLPDNFESFIRFMISIAWALYHLSTSRQGCPELITLAQQVYSMGLIQCHGVLHNVPCTVHTRLHTIYRAQFTLDCT